MLPDQKLIDRVKGFLHPREGETLYEVALLAAKLGPCLEIGSYCGKSTLYLGYGCRANRSVLFSIDHHQGSEEQQPGEEYFDPELFDHYSGRVDTFKCFRQTLAAAALEDTVVPLVCRSDLAARAWQTPLGLVFIDGGHSHEAAQTDYRCWSEHIMANGYLLIHDIFTDPNAGGQAPHHVYRLALASGSFKAISLIHTLAVLQRKP